MLQLVLSRALPSHRLLKRHCLMNPEVLLDIAAKASRPGADLDHLSQCFSLLLHDLRMGGAWKRTNPGRLQQTETMLCANIAPQLAQDLVFLDVGASDAVTTVEALQALRGAFGPRVQAYAADMNLWLLRYRRGPVVEYRATDGEPIMVRVGPFGIRLARQRDALARGGGNVLASFYLRHDRLRGAMRLDARISLINPLARSEPGLITLELDCLRPAERLRGRVSAIRASNVLNLGYFAQAQITVAVGHFHSYLRTGGCLVISRNGDSAAGETENGSVWLKEANGFRRVEDFGCGSEVALLVDAWQPMGADGMPTVSAGSN